MTFEADGCLMIKNRGRNFLQKYGLERGGNVCERFCFAEFKKRGEWIAKKIEEREIKEGEERKGRRERRKKD